MDENKVIKGASGKIEQMNKVICAAETRYIQKDEVQFVEDCT